MWLKHIKLACQLAIIIAYSIIKSKQIRLRPTEGTDRGTYDPRHAQFNTDDEGVHSFKCHKMVQREDLSHPKQAYADQSLFKDSP